MKTCPDISPIQGLVHFIEKSSLNKTQLMYPEYIFTAFKAKSSNIHKCKHIEKMPEI